MGEGETDTPRRDQFSSRDEEQEFRATDFDPTVKRALDSMDHHADVIEGNPESVVDQLIDELLAEYKKPRPDMFRLADIRQRLDQEHTLVMAQSVTDKKAEQYMVDRHETRELDEREEAIREIAKLVDIIPGFQKDIIAMADGVLSETVEAYPPEMQKILTAVQKDIDDANATVAKTFGDVTPTEVEAKLRDQAGLQRVDFETLKMVYAFLEKAKNEMIDHQSDMLHETDAWRKSHQQSS